jgi:hypothetical protein
MGGYLWWSAMRGCRATHTMIMAALALAVLALAAGTASAQPAAVRLTAAGMTTPAGVVVTPDHEVWVSDALYGLCRVTPHGLDIDGEVCAPEPVVPATPPVPAGAVEPAPQPGTRPAGTGQIAFDAASSNFYVAEGTSGASGIWRMP